MTSYIVFQVRFIQKPDSTPINLSYRCQLNPFTTMLQKLSFPEVLYFKPSRMKAFFECATDKDSCHRQRSSHNTPTFMPASPTINPSAYGVHMASSSQIPECP